jgi:hypothetical protein
MSTNGDIPGTNDAETCRDPSRVLRLAAPQAAAAAEAVPRPAAVAEEPVPRPAAAAERAVAAAAGLPERRRT